MTDEELTGRFDSIDQRFEAVDRRFDAVDHRLDGIDHRFETLTAFIREENVETRRHFDIVAEGLKTEIKVIAEGHETLRGTLAALTSRHEQVEKRQDRLEDRQLALEHRQGKLEERR